ncbi:MAG: LacI family transcriptional regulator [Clostridiales bacterium]|nr:LacI family transcriptional regulator [Clostridiales bacterium]
MRQQETKNLTIKDIARLSGVGISTVSRVVNGHPYVKEETKQRVLAVMEEYHFTPNANAKNLKQISANAISVVVRGTNNAFFASILEKMERAIEEGGFQYRVTYLDERSDEIDAARRVCNEIKVRGVIFLGGSGAGREKELESIPVPCVFSTESAASAGLEHVSSITVDDRAAAKQAVDYLFEMGHRDIAVLGGGREAFNNIGLRYQGALDSFREHGTTLSMERYFTCLFSMEDGYRAISEVLRAGKRFTAVFAMSDVTAIGAAKAIADAGLKVPDDISIIGYDGIDLVRYYNPTLATIRQPAEEIAKQSVALLLDAIEKDCPARHVTLRGELLPGASVKRI